MLSAQINTLIERPETYHGFGHALVRAAQQGSVACVEILLQYPCDQRQRREALKESLSCVDDPGTLDHLLGLLMKGMRLAPLVEWVIEQQHGPGMDALAPHLTADLLALGQAHFSLDEAPRTHALCLAADLRTLLPVPVGSAVTRRTRI